MEDDTLHHIAQNSFILVIEKNKLIRLSEIALLIRQQRCKWWQLTTVNNMENSDTDESYIKQRLRSQA